MLIRTPTDLEYVMFDGDRSARIWRILNDDWFCPGCNRTKRQLMKWIDKKRKWIGSVHTHHCHNSDHYTNKRFEKTIVCIDCNSADSAAKRNLKLKSYFSFAPWEIRQFITPRINANHLIDYDIAKQMYDLSIIADVKRGIVPVACNVCSKWSMCKECTKNYKYLDKYR